MKSFIYDNLPYLLLAPLALALLLAEQEIGFAVSRRFWEPSEGLTLGLTAQRMIAALLLVFAIRKIWRNTRC
ncbi:hypothetical protein [Aquipseudomonas guryensis]|uniref:Uncharacterized protein n=1 Tax=Aquipseudomonas guryensis TaxID=2759165 RepID=A0A7W4DAA3_9GAMM|nr:hypothetical protein [Pseudomonas guryensis]MBB1518884.1 hypothetical protein [Pseudomonas guryensis]